MKSATPLPQSLQKKKKEGTLQKIIDTAKETIQSKATAFSAAAAKYSTAFADQAISRLSKFGLAVKSLTSDVLMSPVRAINVPIQLALGFALLGQSLYRAKFPDIAKLDSKELRVRSLVVFANTFGSGGAASFSILGSTIGLITAPLFNTKHFTGKIGAIGMKWLRIIQGFSLDPNSSPKAILANIKYCVTHNNNPKILEAMRRPKENISENNAKETKESSSDHLSTLSKAKLLVGSSAESISSKDKAKYQPALEMRRKMFNQGGGIFYTSTFLYTVSISKYNSISAFYVSSFEEHAKYRESKIGLRAEGKLRQGSGVEKQRRMRRAETVLHNLTQDVQKTQNEDAKKDNPPPVA